MFVPAFIALRPCNLDDANLLVQTLFEVEIMLLQSLSAILWHFCYGKNSFATLVPADIYSSKF